MNEFTGQQKKILIRALNLLLTQLDTDEGVSKEIYATVITLVELLYGSEIATQLALKIDATDDKFYFNNHKNYIEFINNIKNFDIS